METNYVALGAYTKGILDSAASRGILTKAAIMTLINGLRSIHGSDFEIEPLVDAPAPPDASEILAKASETLSKADESASYA